MHTPSTPNPTSIDGRRPDLKVIAGDQPHVQVTWVDPDLWPFTGPVLTATTAEACRAAALTLLSAAAELDQLAPATATARQGVA